MASPTMQKVARAVREYQTGPWTKRRSTGWRGHVVYGEGKIWQHVSALEVKLTPGSVPFQPPASQNVVVKVNLGGIKEVYADEVGMIAEIDLTTGELIPRTEPPAQLKVYLLPLMYPLIGFLLPWGGISLLAWVGTGFVERRC